MSHPHLRRIVLITTVFTLSIVLTLVVEMLAKMHTPGWILAYELLHGPDANLALVALLWIAVDFLLCLAVVWGLYLRLPSLMGGKIIRANKLPVSRSVLMGLLVVSAAYA